MRRGVIVDVHKALKGYTAGQVLGRGARSVIYEVSRRSDGERFAAKFISVRDEADRRAIRHLANEYRVLSLLHQDGEAAREIVRPVEFRLVRSFFRLEAAYLIMERVYGKNLAEFSDYTIRQGVHIFYQVSRALDYVHSKGFVYGDLKPHNILAQDSLHIKLVDFGFAARIGSKLRGLKGTWGFLAPEQAGGQLDVQTDVFNLGAVMYWFFTGEKIPAIVPKDRRTAAYVPPKRLRLIPPVQLNPELPEQLSDLIQRCCKGDAAKRPTMREVLHVLHDMRLRYELGT